MARMKIFDTLEEEAFESPPVFNSAERKRFFSLPLLLEDSMVNLRMPINKVCFLVVAGYFKGQIKYQRARPAKKILFAGIVGYGCDIGHRKLAQISKQIDDGELDNAVNWYFSLQNVQGANDRILRLTNRMSLPNSYRNQSDVLPHLQRWAENRGGRGFPEHQLLLQIFRQRQGR